MVIVDDYRLTDRYLKDQGSLLVYSGSDPCSVPQVGVG